MMLDRTDRVKIGERLKEIDKMASITCANKTRLLNELSKLLLDLEL